VHFLNKTSKNTSSVCFWAFHFWHGLDVYIR
jgi:hypothetical protein